MAVLFLSQWLWYIALLDDVSNLGSSMKTARYLSFEMYGIGYWLCFIYSCYVFKMFYFLAVNLCVRHGREIVENAPQFARPLRTCINDNY